MRHTYYIITIVTIALIAFALLTAHVKALFSTEVEIKNNVIRTGSVALVVTPNEQLFTADALLPGQTVTNTLQIQNSGLSPAHLAISAKKSAGYSTVYDILRLTITRDNQMLYDGLLKDLGTTPLTTTALTPQQIATYTATLTLPATATSTIDDLSTTITFVVTATQAG